MVMQLSPLTPPVVGPSQASSARLLVLGVCNNQDTKVLNTIDARTSAQYVVVLCHEWADTAVEVGDIVRVILTTSEGTYYPWQPHQTEHDDPLMITRDCNLFVHHPDTLIQSTAVADSFMCLRRTVLNYRTPSGKLSDTAAASEAALFGHLIHKMFQIILVADANATASRHEHMQEHHSQRLDAESFFEAAEDALFQHREDLFAAGVSEHDARLVLHKLTSDVMDWYQGFMGGCNSQHANGVSVQDGKNTRRIAVTEVYDIEELIWSPVFGLKGKLDATIRFSFDGVDVGIGVLEFKTGKATGYASVYHSAQVTLYNLMLSDRKDRMVNRALLTYVPYQEALQSIKVDQSQQAFTDQKIELIQTQSKVDPQNRNVAVVSSRGEVVGLMIQRNRLALYMRLQAAIEDLPPLLYGKEEVCAKCFSNESCLVQHKLLERGTPKSVMDGPGVDLFHEKTNHLTKEHEIYYRYWRNLLAVEQQHAGREIQDIWSIGGDEREAKGQCLSGLILKTRGELSKESKVGLLSPGQAINAAFARHHPDMHPELQNNRNLSNSGLSPGDYVVVSAERNLQGGNATTDSFRATATWQSALTNGFVLHLTSSLVVISVERNLEAWIVHQGLDVNDVCWRLDRQEVHSAYNTSKRTMENLFATDESCGAERLRQLVVDLQAPRFSDFEETLEANDDEIVMSSQKMTQMHLNEDQDVAVRMSLRAKDYMLILGMPGTGKTTTLVAVVLATALRGGSVLMCSHTNAAVDNLLCKLIDLGFDDFVRLGRNLEVIDSRIHPYHFSKKFLPEVPLADLERDLQRTRVVATTCLGISHPLLVRREKFDLVVVDEASQILQPICLGPLQMADGPFILVGDHYQLPPLQRTSASRDSQALSGDVEGDAFNGFIKVGENENDQLHNESLFRRLCIEHRDAMVPLTKQYRMAEEIMDLSNDLVYSGSLTCGSTEVGDQMLNLSESNLQNVSSWLKAALDPSRKVVFLDVEGGERNGERSTGADTTENGRNRKEHSDASDRENEVEAGIVSTVAENFTARGLPASDITVLTPFRAQVNLIKKKLKRPTSSVGVNLRDVNVSTIDQYQGKDNCCVVVSFVRGNSRPIGPLLKDWRRLNVALTRAKQKLILVGSRTTLRKGCHVLKRMIEYLEEQRKVYRIS